MAGKVKEAAKGPLWLASFPDERLEQLAHALTDAKAVVAQSQGVDTAGRPIGLGQPIILGRIVPTH